MRRLKTTHIRRSRNRGEEGAAALLLVLGLLMALTAFSAAFVKNVHGAIDRHRAERHLLETQNLAEAGVHKAVATLLSGLSTYSGETGASLGNGVFDVNVSSAVSPSEYVVRSTGKLVDGDRLLCQSVITARVVINSGEAQVVYLPSASPVEDS